MFRVRLRRRIPALTAAVLAAVACLVAGAGEPVAAAAGSEPARLTAGRLLFHDSFSGRAGTHPARSRWRDYSACGYNPTAAFGEIACGDNETLDGHGHLRIPASPHRGSALSTAERFGFTYGVMSAWLKVPPQTGYWPAFWSLNSRPDGRDTNPVGEVDAFEGYTTWRDVYHAIGHSWTTSAGRSGGSPDNYCGRPGVDLTKKFHKYSARIAPNRITFYFDDRQCGPAYTPHSDPGKAWSFGPAVTRKNWLILDLAVGGAGGQQKPATSSARLLVSRVEVRALR